MSLKLNRKGTISYINNHPALMGRELVNQHPIQAIEGLIEALDEKYVMPEGGIPKDDIGFDVSTLYDLDVVKGYLQVQIDASKTNILINKNNITAIQDFLDSIFGDGENGDPSLQEIKFAYRDGFREEFIGEVGDEVITLSNKYLTNGQHLKVYRDGELLLVDVDYTESSDTTITFTSPLEIPVFISCICDSTSTVLSPVHEELIIVNEQTTLKLKNTYRVGDHSLSVFVNGLRLEKGVQYEEVDMETIELLQDYPAGTKVILRQEILSTKGTVLYHDSEYTQKSWAVKIIAEQGQREISLDEIYIPGANMLQVFSDGLLQGNGSHLDYVEVDERTIKFNYDLNDGEIITITCIIGLYNWSETFIALRNQTQFILTNPYISGKNDILVYENGILLQPVHDYIEVNSRTINFLEAPYEGSTVIVYKRR